MSVLFIGKRFYTNRDALREKYGRIYQLPWHWSQVGITTRLWLVDYHSRETIYEHDDALEIISTPVRNIAVFRQWVEQSFAKSRPNMVVASGDCYVGLMAYQIARRLGAYFVFDVYDKYDEFAGYRRLPGFDPFHFLLRRAHARIFASRALMEGIGSDARRDCLAMNGIDTTVFRPLDKRASRIALGLPQDVTFVGYFGTMDRDRGVDDLIDAVRMLRESGLSIKLLLGGKRRPGIDLSCCDIHYLGNLSFDRVPLALACCDVLALPYRQSVYLDMASSCKIAEYISADRPIVATRTPNLVANFPAQAERLGALLAAPGDASDLARVIRAQSEQGVLVNMPVNTTWESIAVRVAEKLALAGQGTLTKAGAEA